MKKHMTKIMSCILVVSVFFGASSAAYAEDDITIIPYEEDNKQDEETGENTVQEKSDQNAAFFTEEDETAARSNDDKELDYLQEKEKADDLDQNAANTTEEDTSSKRGELKLQTKGVYPTEGVYEIVSSINTDYCLDVDAASYKNGANIQLYKRNHTNAQKFHLIPTGTDGVFRIKNAGSGFSLEVSDAGNVYQATMANRDGQLVRLICIEGEKYAIQSVLNDKCICVDGDVAVNKANAQVETFNEFVSQVWEFQETDFQIPEEGLYEIATAVDQNYVMDIVAGSLENRANVQLYNRNGTNAQKFFITSLGGDRFKVINMHSGKALDVFGNKTVNGTNIQQWESNGSSAQVYRFLAQKDGSYRIVGLASGKSIDVKAGIARNSQNIQLYQSNNSAAQHWFLKKTSCSLPPDGMYEIQTSINQNYVMDVAGGSTNNGANIQLYASNGSNAQKFYLKSLGHDGLYSVTNVKSGKSIDVKNSGTSDKTNVQQYTCNNSAAQVFKIVSIETGGYKFIGQGSKKSLDVSSGVAKNKANVQIYSENKTKAQTWYLKKTTPESNGFYYQNGNRYYRVNGKNVTGWKKISGKYYYFDSNGVMQKSKTVYGRVLNSEGQWTGKNTLISSIKAGQKSLKNLLQNPIVVCGRTLWVWGAGWTGSDSQIIGYKQSWWDFFSTHATPTYNRKLYEGRANVGLDCSGFVAWDVYNTVHSSNGRGSYNTKATKMSSSLVGRGLTSNRSWPKNYGDYKPGDVCSTDVHTYICVGTCSDGSAVLIHSTPYGQQYGGGVQFSGTVDRNGNRNSQAYKLAKKYMDNYFPEWPYGTFCISRLYIDNLKYISSWKYDPDGLRNKSAEEIMRIIFNEV